MASDGEVIKLYQFPRSKNFPNLSPFCVKLETYLRMAQIPYENKFVMNTQKAPKQRFPYIELGDEKIGDSSLIIEMLKVNRGDPVDKHLSLEEKAIAVAFQRLLENDLLFPLVYFRWIDATGWPLFKEIVFGKIPEPLRFILSSMIRRKVKIRLVDQGISQHTREEIITIARKDIESLANYLSDKSFFFGDQPSSIDAAILGLIGNCVYDPLRSPLHGIVREFPELQAHTDRMLDRYFPELNT